MVALNLPRALTSLAAAALAFALAACGAQASHYPLAESEARSKLAGTTIPPIAFGFSGSSGPGQTHGAGVVWHIKDSAGNIRLTLLARLAADGDGTSVVTEVKPVPGSNAQSVAAQLQKRPAIAAMYRAIAMEQVDATLRDRPFAFSNIRDDVRAGMISMMPEISEGMDQAAEEFRRQDRETVARAYAQEGQPEPGTFADEQSDPDMASDGGWGYN